jgi:monovalent cation/hydrogen antiporter
MTHLGNEPNDDAGDATRSSHGEIYRRALQVARQTVLYMRASNEIGDDAFHQIEEELDWLEIADGRGGD